MDVLAATAETVLRRHPSPALRLGELHRLVRSALRDSSLQLDRLTRTLVAHPDRFRMLDPWRGPWRHVAESPAVGAGRDPWVVAVSDPGGEGEAARAEGPVDRLRASVCWAAAGVDDQSTWSLARWHHLALSESRARERLSRAA